MSTTTVQQPDSRAFERFADFLSFAIGSPWAFMIALAIVLAWALLGPAAGFSNTWQLIINTGTTIVTFLMIFLLGNASNRITDGQERMLSRIYTEEQRLKSEEQLIAELVERIDVEHIRPILDHLDKQDHQLEQVALQILQAVRQHDYTDRSM